MATLEELGFAQQAGQAPADDKLAELGFPPKGEGQTAAAETEPAAPVVKDDDQHPGVMAQLENLASLPTALQRAVARKLVGGLLGGTAGALAAGGSELAKLGFGAAAETNFDTPEEQMFRKLHNQPEPPKGPNEEMLKIGSKIDPQKIMEDTSKFVTDRPVFQPQSAGDSTADQLVSAPGEAWEKAGDKYGDFLLDKTGSPMVATLGSLGFKFAPQVALGPLIGKVSYKSFQTDLANVVGGSKLREAIDPIGAAGDRAAAIASDYASTNRAAQYSRNETIKAFNQKFSDADAKEMWNALSEENVKKRLVTEPAPAAKITPTANQAGTAGVQVDFGGGKSLFVEDAAAKAAGSKKALIADAWKKLHETQGPSGLDRLPTDQRSHLESMIAEHEQTAALAQKLGILGDRFDVYDPRVLVHVLDDGTKQALSGSGKNSLNAMGQNLVRNLKQAQHERKYLTAEETEAAGQRMGQEVGMNLELLRDVRVLPMITAGLKRAIAGRTLLAELKKEGTRTGNPVIGTKPLGEDWWTVNGSPMFSVRRPVIRNGEVVRDPNGRVVFNTQQIYVAPEYKGPLTSIMDSKDPHVIYKGLALVKSIGTQAIMFNPLVHNVTILSKTFPAFGPKVLGWWWKGMDLMKDRTKVEEMLKDGVVPVSSLRFQSELSGGIPQPKMQRGVKDIADDWWHGKALWDRIAGIQAGVYGDVKADLMQKGVPEKAAGAAAARLANLYGGAIPKEELADLVHKVGNIALFSKSFTGTNLALYKDVIAGFPASTQGKIIRAYEAAGKSAAEADKIMQATTTKFAKRQAMAAIVKDVALAYGGIAITHFAIQRGKHDSDKVTKDYATRMDWVTKQEEKDPFYVLKNPLDTTQYLAAPTEAGKEGRVYLGDDAVTGRPLYGKPGFGKVADDLTQAWKDPVGLLDRKLSPSAKFAKEMIQNKDFNGAKLMLADAGFGENIKRVIDEFVKLQLPSDVLNTVNETLEDRRLTEAQKLRLVGSLVGAFSVSQGVGERKAEIMESQGQHADRMKLEAKDINHLIDTNPTAAVQRMAQLGMKPMDILQRIRSRKMLTSPSAMSQIGAMRNMKDEQLDLLERPDTNSR